MTNTTESRRLIYYRKIRDRARVKLDAVLVCRYCDAVYHVNMFSSASKNHCSLWSCRLAYSAKAREAANLKRLNAAYERRQAREAFA